MIWSELLSRVDRWGDRVALRVGDRRITYSELADIVESLSRPWAKSDGNAVRRALIRQADSCSVLLYILACWRGGVVPVVIRDNAPETQVTELINCLHPELVLLEPIDLNAIGRNRSSSQWANSGLARSGIRENSDNFVCSATGILTNSATNRGTTVAPNAITPVPRPANRTPRFRPRDEALILSTSGSTGVPKLVALPAEAVCMNAAAIAASLELTPEDRLVVNTPLTYMYGLMGGTMAGLWSGAAVHLFPSRLPPSAVQARIRQDQLTVFQSPPSVYRLFAKYWNGEPFPGVRIVTTGGEYLGDDTAAEIRRMFPQATRRFLYGMTEAGPRISHDDMDSGRFSEGGIGQPYSHLEWRIDPVDELSLAENVGRLVLRGPSIFLGYLQPSTGAYLGLDDDKWFHSSDLIFQDAAGRLNFRGRTDRLFKSGGKLVNPSGVERVIASHPGVRAVRCRSQPHALLGLAPAVDIAVVPGSHLSEADVVSLCQAHLDAHAIPRQITLCEELPVSASGKMNLAPAA